LIEKLPESLICDYQYRLSEFNKEHPYCANWVDMGLGKTVSNLMALQTLMDDYMVAHTLIIAPLRVARKVWTDEIVRWDHVRDFEVQKIIGTPAERLKAIRTPAEIHIINRENVSWLVDYFIQQRQWVKKWPWDNVIIDESSSFSYQSSQRWKQLRRVRQKIDRMVQLTGTPDTRNLRGLWAQMFLLDRGKRLGLSEKAFKDRWFDAPSRFDPNANNYTPKPFARAQIQSRLKDVVFALRDEDYIENFKKPRLNYISVTLSPNERKTYVEMEKNYIIKFGDDIVTAVNSGVLANKLLQLANGFIYTEHPKWKAFHDKKIEALRELLTTIMGPCIIAYNYRPDMYRIVEALKRDKVNYRVLESEKDEDDWNAGKIDVLILSPQSAGHGLNLHYSGAENLIFLGLIWSLEQYQQTIARIAGGHRGVGRNNVVHHIVTEDTYEDRVRFVLTRNADNQDEMKKALSSYVKPVLNSQSI
jgi:SNF2 family DNA or RNA helicase